MSHRFNRRQFLLATTTALPLAFMGSHSRATSRTGRPATPTTTTCPPPATSPPKISVVRPPIVGTPGVSYFKIHETPPFHDAFPGMEIFLDGKNVFTCCNELDLMGGWVGVLWEKFNGTKVESVFSHYETRDDVPDINNPGKFITDEVAVYHRRYTQRYIRGVITLARPPRSFKNLPAIKLRPQDEVKFTMDGVDYTVNINTIRLKEAAAKLSAEWEARSKDQIVFKIGPKFTTKYTGAEFID